MLKADRSCSIKTIQNTRKLRVTIYIIATAVVQTICWLFILWLSIENLQRSIFYYISYNIGLLIFPLGYGITLAGLFGWITGIISMFFIVYLIGEVASEMAKRRDKL